MLVIDSNKAEELREQASSAATQEKQANAIADAEGKRLSAAEGKDGRFLTTDADAQTGRALTREVIQSRLLKLNSNLIFERSKLYPEMCGVYILDATANLTDPEPKNRGRRHLVGMEWGVSPEFTVRKVKVNKAGRTEFAGQVRGWRTVLQRLIAMRVISLVGAEKAFQIHAGRESANWHMHLN